MAFALNHRFRLSYNRLFRKNPLAANVFLLLFELAGPDGTIVLPLDEDETTKEILGLLAARFEDIRAHQLNGARP